MLVCALVPNQVLRFRYLVLLNILQNLKPILEFPIYIPFKYLTNVLSDSGASAELAARSIIGK